MNLAAVEKVASTVLYEGYMLYPYRASAVKNRQRFNFGVLYPQSYSEAQGGGEPFFSRTECLLQGNLRSVLEVRVRFLHLIERSVFELVDNGRHRVERLDVDGQLFQSWEEATEREISVPMATIESLLQSPMNRPFQFAAASAEETICNATGDAVGAIVRTQLALSMVVEVRAETVNDRLYKITVVVGNHSAGDDKSLVRERALLQAAVSAHTILGAADGSFVSLLDPGEDLRLAVESCRNVGGFPVLIGKQGDCGTLLASPIILYDYPEIAAESAGDLFDSTEIDEILSLRIMTLTDEEKREARSSDERARRILDRTETLPEDHLMKLHGVLRGMRPLGEERWP